MGSLLLPPDQVYSPSSPVKPAPPAADVMSPAATQISCASTSKAHWGSVPIS